MREVRFSKKQGEIMADIIRKFPNCKTRKQFREFALVCSGAFLALEMTAVIMFGKKQTIKPNPKGAWLWIGF